ncbi:MAG: hypothetical protein RL199_2371, partial [Pseudomonadota bacterium]
MTRTPHCVSRAALAALAVALSACGVAPSAELGEVDFGVSADPLVQRDTGRVVVKFRDGVTAVAKDAAHASRRSKRLRKLRSGAEVVQVAKGTTEAQAKAYAGRADVLWAEPDALVLPGAAVTPNDPGAGNQWQLGAIKAPEAWSISTGSSSVLVAVCDTGVSPTHPDLAASLRQDLCFNTVNNAAGNCEPVHFHGTSVAGCAAAIGNNGVGVAGVSWSAQLIPVRVSNFTNGSAYTSDMAECITYAADKGAHVANLSYQSYSGGSIFQALIDAANYADSKGTVVVVAAGNENVNAVTTQDPANMLYVAATTSANAKSSFSNFGNYVDVAAPGSSVYSTYATVTCADANADGIADGTCGYTDSYASISGTSFSAPITAGAVAVLKAVKPSATTAELRQAITSTATDLGTAGEDVYYGVGLVNLNAAALSLSATANTAPVLTVTAPAGGATTVASTGSVFFAATASDAEQGDLSSSITWTFGTTTKTGATASFVFNTAGTYTVTAKVTDAGGLAATQTATITVTNTAPTVTLTAPAGGAASVPMGGSLTVSASASDAEQGDVSSAVQWVQGATTKTGASATFTFPTAGTYTIAGGVTDAGGLTASTTVTVTVTNTAPVLSLTAPAGGVATVVAGGSVTFGGSAIDAEQGSLSSGIKWTGLGTTKTGASVAFTFPSAGAFTVTAVVTDGGGLSSNTVSVTVTVTAPPVLAAPSNLVATIAATRTVKLTWVDNATSETGFKVERATVNNKGAVGT